MSLLGLADAAGAWRLLESLAFLAMVVLALQIGRAMWPIPGRLSICLATMGVIALWASALHDLAERQPGSTASSESARTPNAIPVCPSNPTPDSSEPAPSTAAPLLAETDERDCHYGAVTLGSVEIARLATHVVLGRGDLLQAQGPTSADERHLALTRSVAVGADAGLSGWSVANVSSRRKLLLTYCDMRSPEVGAACLRTHSGRINLLADRLPIEVGDVVQFSPEIGAAETLAIVDLSSTAEGKGIADRLRFEIAKPGQRQKRTFTLTWSPTGFAVRDEDGRAPPLCGASRFALMEDIREAGQRLRVLARGVGEEQTLIHIGGKSTCANGGAVALSLEGAPYSSIAIAYAPGVGFVFARDIDRGARVSRGGSMLFLGGLDHPLVEAFAGRPVRLDSFVAGRTRYAIEAAGPNEVDIAMTIRPIANSHRLPGYHCNLSANVDVVGRSGVVGQTFCADAGRAAEIWGAPYDFGGLAMGAWRHLVGMTHALPSRVAALAAKIGWPATAVLAGAALALMTLIAWFCRRIRFVSGNAQFEPLLRRSAIALGLLALCDFVVWKIDPQFAGARADLTPDAPWGALWLWAVAVLAVATARGGALLDGAVMLVTTAIIALGHCSLMAMSLDASETNRLRFADDTTHAIAAAAALIIIHAQLGPAVLAGAARRLVRGPTWLRMPVGLWALGAAMGLVLAAWFALGTEIGIAGFLQPSEIVKTLIVGLLAVVVTLALDRERERVAMAESESGAPEAAGRGRTLVSWLPFLILAAAGAALLALRDRVGPIAGRQDLVETAGVGLVMCAVAYSIVRVRDPMWSSFLMIVTVLVAILLVPVFRNDLSAFLVIGITTVTTLIVVVIIHGAAMLSEYLDEKRLSAPPPPASWRMPRPRRAHSDRWDFVAIQGVAFALRWTWRLLLRRPFEVAAVLGFLAIWGIFDLGQFEISHAAESRRSWAARIGTWQEKPVLRLISWIELNARPGDDQKTIAVEFVDVGLQGLLARAEIASSACGAWRAWRMGGDDKSGGFVETAHHFLAAPFAVLDTALEGLAERAGCAGNADARTSAKEALQRESKALETPEIQNDFIGAWLLVALGRRGALEVVLLQCVLVGLMILAAFRTVRWTRAHVRNRPAASAAAYSVIGFALMMATQWSISWANALAIVPVMGQPATFLSHGPSHMLLFGVPAILATFSALRLRSALTVLPYSDDLPPVPWSRIYFHRRRRRRLQQRN